MLPADLGRPESSLRGLGRRTPNIKTGDVAGDSPRNKTVVLGIDVYTHLPRNRGASPHPCWSSAVPPKMKLWIWGQPPEEKRWVWEKVYKHLPPGLLTPVPVRRGSPKDKAVDLGVDNPRRKRWVWERVCSPLRSGGPFPRNRGNSPAEIKRGPES